MISKSSVPSAAAAPAGATTSKRFQELKKEIHTHLVSSMNLEWVGTMNDYELRRELRQGIRNLCQFRSELLSQSELERLINEVIDETLGLGPIEPLLRDPTVSDILIDGPKRVYVERHGRLEDTDIQFHDNAHLIEIVQRIVSKVGRRLDESSPMVDARLEDGSRVNAVTRPLALDGALVSIRRFGQQAITARELIQHGTLTPHMLEFLVACIRARLNIVISGGTGSGKTTLLNVLSGFIPAGERLVTIEDAAELQLRQPRVARMETRPANIEGKGAITARDLLRNALRMRPDRILIGECRGPEAFDMLQAMTTGHAGSLTTIHANSARDALRRLEMLVGVGGYDLPPRFVHELIASSIQIVVQCHRLPSGERRVTQVTEITGTTGERMESHDLFEFRGTTTNGRTTGQFHATGIRPRVLEEMKSAGFAIPPALFEERVLPVAAIDGDAYHEGNAK
ncbi:CpaF family protein [Rubinisphaera brasiliensis]|uniref:Type II secretion system protein E n=1 Tax=Rubinisphaera brasiliensis (strain ATCC 49424 / DSM 5305 / JCM 21570 / IAM 15109 / NBRC 103401 / IFAM 1448) TaxID=756272 RepID=F0SKA6_RUBBR|nr:CpaF family protein [Rubinisphaera brasiliensis]ADY60863.1 type II secretion system protein E [Rubinisphaera brasiliensis DSM 5305]